MAYKPAGKRSMQVDDCRVGGDTSENARRNKAGKISSGFWNNSNEPGPRPWGARTLQVDECRIGTEKRQLFERRNESSDSQIYGDGLHGGRYLGTTTTGRWPANVCHDGSAEVMEAFAAFGERRSCGNINPTIRGIGYESGAKGAPLSEFYKDTGTAARFFYCAKANKTDRAGSKHPTIKPIALMRWLVRLVTPRVVYVCDWCDNARHENSTKTASSVSSVRAMRPTFQTAGQSPETQVLLQEERPKSGQQAGKSRSNGQAATRLRAEARAKTDHRSPLCGQDQGFGTCATCGGHLRVRPGLVLDPFAGSGTTGAAALAEGRQAILIERELEYCADIKRRLEMCQRCGSEPATYSTQPKVISPAQMSLFLR